MTPEEPASTEHPLRIGYPDIVETLFAILRKRGFAEDKARVLAQTFADNSLDGVYTHGLNRFPRFIHQVEQGHIQIDQEPVLKHSAGALEQWDGQLGPGILNALEATDRAMALAQESGLGCVAMANTNHWMRGGTYGWRAAKQGFMFIGWTNTIANMPAWGAMEARLGNNPLVLAAPYQDEAMVLDTAMSQFSYGALESHQRQGKRLSVPGGFDRDGELSQDPGAILETERVLPIGYWKGAGLSLLLDVFAAILSGGLSTAEISRQGAEYAVSQVFIAVDSTRLGNAESIQQSIGAIIADYHAAQPAPESNRPRFPGEGALSTRQANRCQGVPVDPGIWAGIQAL